MGISFPQACVGCGKPGIRMCGECKTEWSRAPQRVTTLADPHVPVWSLGEFGGVRRRTIINLKERGRTDAVRYLGPVVAVAVEYLAALGEVEEDFVLLPAPTRMRSAQQRGGDPVELICRASGLRTERVLWHRPAVSDSVGLDVSQRRSNLSGNVFLTGVPSSAVLIVDDVITTGATLAESVAVLTSANVKIRGALGLSNV
ncbi:ComF family protein [Corynebacterium silvaticum]|uniref:ComF family protein n=1 Tax=Corynebacterium silvaticum TaxID=2320431 RepID=UPI00143046EF|nr:ComF family protein [Corynebacterium silvaticum]NON70387.1 ComF family protein [Corynebacterium silvaticum]UWH00767.1 ComF family protein [Corynebacterium silvaticum]UWH02814.1 ComF family protein [Corynebacterium silvaticum]UWH04854.1 ComF family protein [Corynebacterium silvaticum]UXZ27013.1 ComF family protein [Corynebacterium silvaticum]